MYWEVIMEVADLHIHSTASDGLLSPAEVVEWGVKRKLKAISLTDHDNISGIELAVSRSKGEDIEIVPGIELSTDYYGIEVHMLGYFIDYKSFQLNSFLTELQINRAERAEKMVKKLNSMGCKINYRDVLNRAKDESSIGRPHIARVLVENGYSKSLEEAFEKYIGFGKPAYVERYKITPFEAVELILSWKGVPSIAHPGLIKNTNREVLIKELKKLGLRGIEAYHTKHDAEQTKYFQRLAGELDLIPTGGTDCHGNLANGEPLIGSVTIPYKNVDLLRNC